MSASSVVAAAAAAAEGDRPEHSGQAHVADSEPLLPAETQQQISTRCGQAMQGAITSLCIYLGHELGLYKTLHGMGPSTAQQLATAAGLSERWVREWLYQQSASRLVCCDSNAERWVAGRVDRAQHSSRSQLPGQLRSCTITAEGAYASACTVLTRRSTCLVLLFFMGLGPTLGSDAQVQADFSLVCSSNK